MNHVETVLLENIDKPRSLFVFPTDVAASRWADHLLRLRRGGTVAMEKFIAWDTFKQRSIHSKVPNKQSIPPALRKMFVNTLIRENARLCARGQTPILTSLIPVSWAGQAGSFTGWLTEILPQLAVWFRRASGLPIEQIGDNASIQRVKNFSDDDRDLFNIALHYSQFLDKHGLFEPAWESPPFGNMGNECFIFFSECLFDFNEYRELLTASDHVTIIGLDLNGAKRQTRDVFYYTNSRSEITGAALYILALHDNQKASWDSISVSIPETGNYDPYLRREFENRNIPYIKRSGKPLASYPAGQFFRALTDCTSSDFSFSSLTALLLNRHLPWKDNSLIPDLVEFGIRNNCIYSWIEEEDDRKITVNAWDDAFTRPFGGYKPETRRFFEDLRRRANAMCNAKSFAEIRKQYFAFRERFFDMDNCLGETDTVLSRCISELMYLAEIEKSFPNVQVSNPYIFFTGYLEEVSYLAQQTTSGVTILPYRTAAPAPFECHIVLGASQDNLSAVFSPLAFLPTDRREKLGIADNDASQVFIDLHQFNSRLPAAFFCSEQTFSGYAIPHSTLNAAAKPQAQFEDSEHAGKFSPDLYRQENNFYASLQYQTKKQESLTVQKEIYQNQRHGFEAWRLRSEQTGGSGIAITRDHSLLEMIRQEYCKNREFKDKFSVSASSLKPYFQCPLKWLFERVLKLEYTEIETSLMANNIWGLVYHAVLNLFLDELRNTGGTIDPPADDGSDKKPLAGLPEPYRRLLAEKVAIVFECFPCLPGSTKIEMSMLTARLLRAEKQLFYSQLEKFLAAFVSFFAGYRVCASESYYALQRDSHYLSGIVDCILEDDHAAVIVDFKTKNMPNLSDCTGEDGLADFQLPLYLRLVEDALKKEVNTALFFSIVDAAPRVLFGSIRNSLSGAGIPKKQEDIIMRGSTVFTDIMNEFDEKAEQFAGEIRNGAFAFRPSDTQLCFKCSYAKICRTAYKIRQEKNHA